MAHLSRWMAHQGLEVSALTPQRIEEYFCQQRLKVDPLPTVED
jgi:hypothetical protein